MSDQSYLDWPFFEQAHRDLVSSLGDWADKEITPLADEEPADDDAIDDLARRLVARLAAGGWAGIWKRSMCARCV